MIYSLSDMGTRESDGGDNRDHMVGWGDADGERGVRKVGKNSKHRE